VLDAEAVSTLAGRPSVRHVEVRAAMRAAARLGREVIVPNGHSRRAVPGVHSKVSSLTPVCRERPASALVTQIGDWLGWSGACWLARAGSERLTGAHVVAAAGGDRGRTDPHRRRG
jgi:hypothetical protein